jgi:hypothetical protein
MGEACHYCTGPPRTRGQAHMEAAQQSMNTPQTHPQEPQWDTGYGGGYSGYHEGSYYPSHGYLVPSLQAGTSASTRYVGYGADQADHTVEVIERLKQRMDDFATVQTIMQASIDS